MIPSKYKNLRKFAEESRIHWDFWLGSPNLESWHLYAENFALWEKRPKQRDLIPKVIHQIWIGPTVPESVTRLADSWKSLMPEYEYRLWRDKEIDDLEFSSKRLYNSLANPGAKSDIARYAILEKHGGLYVDTDFECIRSLNPCLVGSSFVCGHLPLGDHGRPELNNGLIASTINNPILQQITSELNALPAFDDSDAMAVMDMTGPHRLTRVVAEYLTNEAVGCLPSNYFYPWPYFLKDSPQSPYEFITEQTFAIHHWHCSWMGHSGQSSRKLVRLKRFVQRLNPLKWT
jgi:mannosyltransferase OCH1-like enzyme